MRYVTVVFINIVNVSLDPDSDGSCERAVRRGQLIMTELQRIIFNYHGAINKLLIDDKGRSSL